MATGGYSNHDTSEAGYGIGVIEKIMFERRHLGVTLTVIQGDITCRTVDAIVNPSDKDLNHQGGLARVIIQKGGKSIRAECTQYVQSHGGLEMSEVFCSTAGGLPHRNVLHCCVPEWQDGQHREEKNLRQAVKNSLQTACDKKFQSIAIPALGSGVHGMPEKTTADTIVEALKDFFDDQHRPVQEIFLCDIKYEAVECFTKALQTFFPQSETKPESFTSQPQMHRNQSGFPSSTYDDDDERISLKPYEIEILKRFDIMKTLNTGNRPPIGNLDPETGCAIFKGPSHSVTQATEQLRKKLKEIKKEEGPISARKRSYICQNQTEKVIWNMLEERGISCVYWTVEKKNLIVYGLKDNDVVVAFSIIKNNVTEFTMDLSDADFDLTRGKEWTDNLKKINNALDAYIAVTIEGKSLVIVTITAKKDLTKELIEQFFMEKSVTTAKGNVKNKVAYPSLAEISIYKMATYCVTLMQGNITDVVADRDVDVVVNSMSLKRDGGLAREIFRKAGSNIEKQIMDKIKTGEFKEGDFHITDGGQLQCQMIVHVFCRTWEEGLRREKEHLFENMLSCLQRANSLGLESIVFPPLGTGICGMPPRVSAKTMADAIVNFYGRTNLPYITKIYICCKEQDHVDRFRSTFSKSFQGSNASDARPPAGAKTLWRHQGSTPQGSQTQNSQPQKYEMTLTKDPMKIKLLKLPKTKQYIDDTIHKTLGRSCELKYCPNEVKLSALTKEIAEQIKEKVEELIVKREIKTKYGNRKKNELIHLENHAYPGKLVYHIDEENVVICATFDVSEKSDVIELVNWFTSWGCVIQ